MIEQKAIGYLKTLPNRIPLKFYTDDGVKVYDEFSQVVTSALEKQIPKKVKEFGFCPVCYYDFGYKPVKYCPECGQKLDRGNENEY